MENIEIGELAEGKEIELPESPMIDINDESLTTVERLTLDPRVDADKLKAIIDMQYVAEDRRAKKEFIQAMVRVQTNLRAVSKNAANPSTHSSFANLEALKKAVVPAYTAEGFMLTYGEGHCDLEDYIRVTARLMHTGGHVEEYFYDCPMDDTGFKGEKNKTKTHGKASAVSYSERYIIKLIFNVTIQDEDNDGNTATGNFKYIGEYQDQIDTMKVFLYSHIDGHGGIENTQKFLKVWESIPDEVQNQYWNNLPKGEITKIKNAVRDMSLESRTLARECLEEIKRGIEVDDYNLVIEAWQELETKSEKRIIKSNLEPDQWGYVLELIK